MSTLKVNTIQDTTGDNALTFDSSGNTTIVQKLSSVNGNGFPSAGALSHRNLIINGAMQVAQRGTSSTTAGYSTLDRWKTSVSGVSTATVTQSQQSTTSSDTPWNHGFRNYWRHSLDQAGSVVAATYCQVMMNVEAQDVANSGWDHKSASSYITLSFWVRASSAMTYYGTVMTTDGTRNTYPFSFALSANTWTKVTKTIPGNTNCQIDNDNGTGFRIYFYQYYGTDYTNNATLNAWSSTDSYANTIPDMASTWITAGASTYDLTGVQIEVGETATEFEHRSFGEELSRCLRYYEKSYAYGTAPGTSTDSGRRLRRLMNSAASTTAIIEETYNVEKRATPTVVTYGTDGTSGKMTVYNYGSTTNHQNSSVAGSTSRGFEVNSSGNSMNCAAVFWTADAEF